MRCLVEKTPLEASAQNRRLGQQLVGPLLQEVQPGGPPGLFRRELTCSSICTITATLQCKRTNILKGNKENRNVDSEETEDNYSCIILHIDIQIRVVLHRYENVSGWYRLLREQNS